MELNTMRIFLAIQLEAEVKEYLSKIQEIARKHSNGGNYSYKENLHLTVRFIGEATPELQMGIKESMKAAATEIEAFNLFTDKIGFFSRRNKIILWTGVKGDIECLQRLYNVIENELEKVGISKEEMSYNPHLTLGREIQLKGTLKDIEKELQLEEKKIEVREITLMESTRENGRLIYKPLYTCPFRRIT